MSDPKKDLRDIKETTEINTLLITQLSKQYISVALLYMSTGNAAILKSSLDPELVEKKITWGSLIDRYIQRRAYIEDKDNIQSQLSFSVLEKMFHKGMESYTDINLKVRCYTHKEGMLDWVEISVSILDPKKQILLITTKNIQEQVFLQDVVNKFIYQNVDYFILLNLKQNNYSLFSGKSEYVPIPDINGENYTDEMIRFNRKYVVPTDAERVIEGMRIENIIKSLENSDEFCIICGAMSEDGRYRHSKIQFICLDRACGLVILTRLDITNVYLEEKHHHEQLFLAIKKAQLDLLTNIYNHNTTVDIVSKTLSSCQHELAAILFIDIDNFKYVNDTLGHLKGDELLKYSAGALKEMLSSDAVLGRIGGDEFLIYTGNIHSTQQVIQLAQKICKIYESLPDEEVKKLNISCSVGISFFPRDGLEYSELVQKADKALYHSKRHGKNKYSFYTPCLP